LTQLTSAKQDTQLNGILFVITEEVLKAFDDREWIYERIPIQDALRSVAVLEEPHGYTLEGQSIAYLICPVSIR
jgi:hypothetical protein